MGIFTGKRFRNVLGFDVSISKHMNCFGFKVFIGTLILMVSGFKVFTRKLISNVSGSILL